MGLFSKSKQEPVVSTEAFQRLQAQLEQLQQDKQNTTEPVTPVKVTASKEQDALPSEKELLAAILQYVARIDTMLQELVASSPKTAGKAGKKSAAQPQEQSQD